VQNKLNAYKAIFFGREPPELLKQLKDNLYDSVVITTVLVLVTFWLLFNTVPSYILWLWAGIQFILAVVRFFLVRKLVATGTNKQQFRTTKVYYTVIMLLIGLSWGSASILASLYSSEITLITLALIIAGITAGAVSTLTPVFSGFTSIFLGSTLLLFIAMVISPYDVLVTISPIILLYTGIVFSSGYKLYNSLLGAIELTHELQHSNEMVLHQKDYAEQANKAKSTFLSSMSHELRTPLNAILGFSQLLKMDELNPQQTQNLEEIHIAGEHLLALINEVLDLSKVESGEIALKLEPILIQSCIGRCISMVTPLANQHDISLSSEKAKENWIINADEQRVQQVFLNLLSNAIKYNREAGSVKISCRLMADNFLRILVTDTGLGIAKEKYDEVFSPFHRLGWEAGMVEGTGIGLFFSKKLLESMGGKIGFDSVQGVGSRFWCDLPLVEEDTEVLSQIPT
jgi:signal transduction histidine kinase